MIPRQIIEYYSLKKNLPFEKASLLFEKLENFLFGVVNNGIKIPTVEVDDLWHTFILDTKLYQKYCIDNFGIFIHHNPHLPKHKHDCNSGCDAGGDERTLQCTGEEEDEKDCDAALNIKIQLARCEGGGDGGDGSCDAQLVPLIKNSN
jgi:hypothetical protein